MGPGKGRVSVSFSLNLIGLSERRGQGRGLIPPGACRVGRRAALRKGHAPGPQCTAGRVTRSGRYPALQVRPGPSQSSFLPSRGRSNPWLAAPLTLPASRHGPGPGSGVYRPTQGRSQARAVGAETGCHWSLGALEGRRCREFVPCDLRGVWGHAGGSCPLADLPRVWGSPGRGALGCPRELDVAFPVSFRQGGI